MHHRSVAALALHCTLGCASHMPAAAQPSRELVSTDERYLGGNPTGWAHNWCAEFLNRLVLQPLGLAGADATAASFLRLPRATPRHGAIVVLTWRHTRADHVGLVDRVLPDGRIRILSGQFQPSRSLWRRAQLERAGLSRARPRVGCAGDPLADPTSARRSFQAAP